MKHAIIRIKDQDSTVGITISYENVDSITYAAGRDINRDLDANVLYLQLAFKDGETATFGMDEIIEMYVY